MLQRRIKEDDAVLVVSEIWLEKIFSGTKWLEIRPFSVKQGRIYLCQSKTSTVLGHARVEEVLGPLRADEWAAFSRRFLFLRPPADSFKCELGELLLDEALEGQLYVKVSSRDLHACIACVHAGAT